MLCSACQEKGPPGSSPWGLWSHHRAGPKPRLVSPHHDALCAQPPLGSGCWEQKGTREGLRSWDSQVRERTRT